MKNSIKKFIALAVSSVMSVSALTVTTAAAENVPPVNGSYSITPRAALPSGAYYSTSNPTSFIMINSDTNATCLVNLVIYDSEGNKISGTGYYYYNLNSKVLITLDSCYVIDIYGNRIPKSSYSFYVTYSGGSIIVNNTGEEFVL